MPRFTVTLRRTVPETAELIIEAETLEEARRLADEPLSLDAEIDWTFDAETGVQDVWVDDVEEVDAAPEFLAA
jgi:hypothetical protein